jgi:hypothetical protein
VEVNKTDKYQIGTEDKRFKTPEEFKTWLAEETKNHKVNKVFRDGTPDRHVGYMWAFWDQYTDSKAHFKHEIWLEVFQEEITPFKLS